MTLMDRFSTRTQIIAPALVAMFVMAATAMAIGVTHEQQLIATKEREARYARQVELLEEIKIAVSNAHIALYRHLLFSSIGAAASSTEVVGAQVVAEIDGAFTKLEELETLYHTAAMKKVIKDLSGSLERYREEASINQDTLRADSVTTSVLMTQADVQFDVLHDVVKQLLQGASEDEQAASERTAQQIRYSSSVGALTLFAGCLGATLLAWLVARTISRPLVDLAAMVERASIRRSLVHWPGTSRRDEIGFLARSLEAAHRSTAQAHDALARHADSLEVEVARRTETLEKQQRELERSNQELQRFAYVASHDLKEPLRLITSYTQLIERRYGHLLDDKGRQFVAFAVDGAHRMQALITDLLDYSRVGSGEGKRVPTDLGACLDVAMTNLRASLEETGARVTPPRRPVQLLVDPGQIIHLLQNLISNAVKFRGEAAPEVVIEATEQADGMQCIRVRDNGIGIPEEHHERVFEMFQRLHPRSVYEGTGIGLAVCKRIVEQHGGRLWVEAGDGPGTTFVLTLPGVATDVLLAEAS